LDDKLSKFAVEDTGGICIGDVHDDDDDDDDVGVELMIVLAIDVVDVVVDDSIDDGQIKLL
jgi:hypothetical protein